MYPELFHYGPLTIHTYGVFYALGILSAVALAECLYRRSGGVPGTMTDLAFPTVIGILLGARALFVFVEHDYYLRHPVEILKIWQGGLVFYGGLMGGALLFFMTVHRRKLDIWPLADSAAPATALGHAIGRLGCFFAGSCYGKPADVPWAVVFTDPGSLAGDVLGVPVHPAQLYSAAYLFILSVVLILLGSRAVFRGQVITTYAIFYGSFRFFVEFLRGDPRGEATLLGIRLSTSQWISLVVVPVALALYFYLLRKSQADRRSKDAPLEDRPGSSLNPELLKERI